MQPTGLALLAVYHRVFANVTLTELCDIEASVISERRPAQCCLEILPDVM